MSIALGRDRLSCTGQRRRCCLSATSVVARNIKAVADDTPPIDMCCGSPLQSSPGDQPVDRHYPQLQSLRAVARDAVAAPEVRGLRLALKLATHGVSRCCISQLVYLNVSKSQYSLDLRQKSAPGVLSHQS